jgi:ubiquinone/menaquinone biosynthesis C-methylase UbiE
MTTTVLDRAFVGSIPEFYDRYMVPLIFEPYAADLGQRIAALGPTRVLEIAAGTGAVTRSLVKNLGERADVTVTDINEPMLEYAKTHVSGSSRLLWRQADAIKLPFEDRQFDAVVCQFGAMFFPDRVRGYSEAHRVLTPDGTFIFNVWDRISANDFANVVTEALSKIYNADPPMFLARTPHGYHDEDLICRDLREAGFNKIEIEPLDAESLAPSPRFAAVAYCQGTPLRGEIEARGEPSLNQATQVATEALAQRFGHGEIKGRIRALIIRARR